MQSTSRTMSHTTNKNTLHGLAGRLVSNRLLDYETAVRMEEIAQHHNTPFISVLIQRNILSSKEIAKATAKDFGLPLFDLAEFKKDMIPSHVVSSELMVRNRAIPLFIRGKNLFIALSDPTNSNALNEFKFHSGLNTFAVVVEDHKLAQMIQHETYHTHNALCDLTADALAIHQHEDDIDAMQDMKDDFIINSVNKIILDAINLKASDIHFEPYINSFRVRYRIDGILHEMAQPPSNVSHRMAARLKVMSKLDISERRVPQDGHFKMMLPKQRSFEFRVNTCPTIAGEKIVLRLIDPVSTNIDIEQLGYDSNQKDAFLEAIHRLQGMVVVTGPTGSGKTVSLYTLHCA
jgi:type IV pilus assembly protein PilB